MLGRARSRSSDSEQAGKQGGIRSLVAHAQWLEARTWTVTRKIPRFRPAKSALDYSRDSVCRGRATGDRVRRIALVEDSEDNRVLVAALLEDRFECVAFVDGASALEGLPAVRPALILLDISLPRLGGEQVLGAIKQQPSLARVPVIALTAHSMRGDRERFLAMGFDDYISKPILDEDAFIATIERWVDAPVSPLSASVRAALTARYARSLADKLDAVERAIVEAGTEDGRAALRRLGHQLGGSAGSFGWPEIGKLGEQMHGADDEDLLAAATRLVEALREVTEAPIAGTANDG